LIGTLTALYGAAAAWRRAWYDRDPSRRRWLARPVVSVGNLRVGGSGKTPIVEYIARLLAAHGERPAVLTRGYARRVARDGVTVVSDGTRVIADLDLAGDEPLMLARALPGVPVLVGADRYLSGLLAERRLGATVHVLDDGFQHLALGRDVDLLLVSEEDLADRPLPAGRLRERLTAARAADAALVTAGYDSAADRIARAVAVSPVFRVARAIGVPRTITGARDSVVVPPASRVFVATGIARPDRFVADIEAAGWEISGVMEFRDHHRYDARDVDRIAADARAKGSAIVLTTEKDAVRLAACDLTGLPIAAVPLTIAVEPAEGFERWLLARIGDAQSSLRAPQ
jgi:tetraacyldisaccharide 4'-kinase